jgi:hypothetical protein
VSKNYPKAWPRFVSQIRASEAGVPEELAQNFAALARWSARFRLAKSFKGLDLGDHYAGSNTPQLYSAITRIFLVYSAFETYCRIMGWNPSQELQLQVLQDAYSQKNVIQAIRDLDPKNAFSSFLEAQLTHSNLKKMMREFQAGKDVNVSFLARCTRHIFAHGILTANSSRLSVKRFSQISQMISDFLLHCMDEDFNQRVPAYELKTDS